MLMINLHEYISGYIRDTTGRYILVPIKCIYIHVKDVNNYLK